MPDRRLHLKFDDYLKSKGIINEFTNGNSVHDRMDRGVDYFGPDHREIDYYHSEEGIRSWLSGFQHLAYPETLRDYLRIGLGHIVLDEIESRSTYYDEYDLLKRAYRSFIARGYHYKFYRYR